MSRFASALVLAAGIIIGAAIHPAISYAQVINGLLTDPNGTLHVNPTTNAIGQGTGSIGPVSASAIGSGTSSNTVVSSQAGRVFSVLITATGSNAFVCYDNASAASGTVVVSIPASSAVGIYPFNIPLANGLTCAGNAANPGVTIAYS